jgi:molecular chaperone DnaJ
MYLVRMRLNDQLSGYDAQDHATDAPQEDPYDVMGVATTASTRDIKKAFRSLAKKYHPDHNPSTAAADRFRGVNDAYELLSNDARRKQFDNMASSFK